MPGGSPRGPGSRTLTDGQRDEGHLDEERQPAQHIHEPHGAPAPPGPAPRQPGRPCALRLGRYGAAATATASPPRRPPCAAAERSPARAPTPAASGLAPPLGAEGQLLPVRRACSRTARLLLETVSDAAWARQEGTEGRERGTSTRARMAVSGPSCALPHQPGGVSRAGEGCMTATSGQKPPGRLSTGLSLATAGNGQN